MRSCWRYWPSVHELVIGPLNLPITKKELIKDTPEEHMDYRTLCSALELMKNLTKYVDEKKKQMDMKREFSLIQKKQESISLKNYVSGKVGIRQMLHEVIRDVTKSEDRVLYQITPCSFYYWAHLTIFPPHVLKIEVVPEVSSKLKVCVHKAHNLVASDGKWDTVAQRIVIYFFLLYFCSIRCPKSLLYSNTGWYESPNKGQNEGRFSCLDRICLCLVNFPPLAFE